MCDRSDYLLYDRSAWEYDRQRFKGVAGRWGHYRQVVMLKHLVGDCQGKRVLEIGCGTGRITEVLAGWGAKVMATDISEEMLQVAQARFNDKRQLQMAPDFKRMSVFNIDINLQDCDYVLMVNVLGHLSKPREAINGISTKMSQTCRFVFNFPCLTSVLLPVGLMVNLKGASLFRDVTSRWYRPATIEKYCRDAGLEIVRLHGTHYVPFPRILFPTLPLFWTCDKLLAEAFPKRCPSVFVECRRSQTGP